jgi:hypothetical protein
LKLANKRCRDCAFFSLTSEGLDLDRCRFFDKSLSREEAMLKIECPEYILREDEKDVEFYMPERSAKKDIYEKEIRKYSIYMVVLVVLGIGFFYIVTAVV